MQATLAQFGGRLRPTVCPCPLPSRRAFTARQRVGCDLLHALRFERGTRARFLLAVAAVEAVLEPAARGGAGAALVEDMLARVAAADLPAHERQSLASSVAFLRRESISPTSEVEAAAAVLRDAVEVLLSRGQEAGAVRADATVDEVYVLIRALANAWGDRAVVDGAVDIVLDGLSPRRSE